VAKKLDTAMNVLGAAAAVTSFLNLNNRSPANSKLTRFYASLKKHPIARTNRFEVLIGLPEILSPYRGSETANLLQLRCETANVPGVTITTADIQRYGFGMIEKVPTGATMADFTCSFIGDDEGEIYKLFYRWMNGIVKWDGKPSFNAPTSYNNLRPYEHEYKSKYASTISILTYNENEDKLIAYELYEAFPTSIGEVSYNWGDNDNLVRIPINFSYSYFKVQNIDSSVSFKPGVSNDLGLLGTLIKAGTAIQTIGALKKPQNIGDIINVVNNAKIVVGGLNL